MKISQSILNQIISHGQKELPNEACGLLAESGGVIKKHYELTNIEPAPNHYSVDPLEQLAADKDARASKLTLCAIYHSHPISPAWPSPEDILLAYDSDISYLIVSFNMPETIIKSFKIENGEVREENIDIV